MFMNCRHFWLIQAYKKLSAELTKSKTFLQTFENQITCDDLNHGLCDVRMRFTASGL